jgi:lysozyme family protein
MYTPAFEFALDHAMLYEVGGHWKLTPEVEAGLITTQAQRRAVGYVNDPFDRGGETKFGVAKRANVDLNITTLTWAQAKDVYFRRYWLAGRCDRLPNRIAVLHFDGCVNHGNHRAITFLQRAAGTSPDGIIGPMTLGRIRDSDPFALCNQICDLREQFYRNIVARDATQGRFLRGWLRRIDEMRQFSTDPSRSFV